MTIGRRGFLLSLVAGFSSLVLQPSAGRSAGCLTIFAASSLSLAVDALAVPFAKRSGCVPTISYAASSTLARQIAAGAPADIFLSADAEWVRWLRKRVDSPSEPLVFAGNGLVIALPSDRALSPDELRTAMHEGRIATGDPDHVPLGRYVRQVLERDGQWQALSRQILPFDSAAAATRAVRQGLADLGILYETDARAAGLSIAGTLADPSPPVAYEALALSASPQVAAFLSHVTDPESTRLLSALGFRPTPKKPV